MFIFLLPLILLNPVSCRADGLLGDAHDAADVAVVQAHLIEAEERLRVGERGSGIEGFPHPLLLSRKLFVPLQPEMYNDTTDLWNRNLEQREQSQAYNRIKQRAIWHR